MVVSQSGRYYGYPFAGNRGVTNGYPLSPTIFNKLVDTVILHWDVVVAGKAADLERFGRSLQILFALFYSDGGLLAFPHPSRFQASLDVMMGLFKCVRH